MADSVADIVSEGRLFAWKLELVVCFQYFDARGGRVRVVDFFLAVGVLKKDGCYL